MWRCGLWAKGESVGEGRCWVRPFPFNELNTHSLYNTLTFFFSFSLWIWMKISFFLKWKFFVDEIIDLRCSSVPEKKGTFTVLCTAKESCCCYFNNEIIPTWILLFDFDERKRLIIIIIIIIKRLSFSTENCPWGRWQKRKISKHRPIIKAEIIFHQFLKGRFLSFVCTLTSDSKRRNAAGKKQSK